MQPIRVEDYGSKGKTGFYLENDKVIFDYDSLFDADTHEWNHAYGKFPVENYINGIKELKEKGFCLIEGDECSLKIDIWTNQNRLSINFDGKGYANSVLISGIEWTVEDLEIKPETLEGKI